MTTGHRVTPIVTRPTPSAAGAVNRSEPVGYSCTMLKRAECSFWVGHHGALVHFGSTNVKLVNMGRASQWATAFANARQMSSGDSNGGFA